MAKYVIVQIGHSRFQFKFVSDGKVIMTSQTFNQMLAVNHYILLIQTTCRFSDFYKKYTSSGKYHFAFSDDSRTIIASSEMYSSELERDLAIESVMSNGTTGEIESQIG